MPRMRRSTIKIEGVGAGKDAVIKTNLDLLLKGASPQEVVEALDKIIRDIEIKDIQGLNVRIDASTQIKTSDDLTEVISSLEQILKQALDSQNLQVGLGLLQRIREFNMQPQAQRKSSDLSGILALLLGLLQKSGIGAQLLWEAAKWIKQIWLLLVAGRLL